jgi:hypothetical protein
VIRHVVIVQFRKIEGVDYKQILEKTRELVTEIPGVMSYQIHPNMSHYVPKEIESWGVEILFENEEALKTFMSHSKHFEANALFENYLADPPYLVLTHQASFSPKL